MSQKGASRQQLKGAGEPPASSSDGPGAINQKPRNNRLDDDRVICEDRCGISDVLFFCTFLVCCIFTE